MAKAEVAVALVLALSFLSACAYGIKRNVKRSAALSAAGQLVGEFSEDA